MTDWFDVLVFVENTTAARANPWVRIVPGATVVRYGIAVVGSGSAWLDSVSLSIE